MGPSANGDVSAGDKCPVDHSSFVKVAGGQKGSSDSKGGCPVDHGGSASKPAGHPPTPSDSLNPLNMMPNLSQHPLSASQRTVLSTSRTQSSIPRPDVNETWDYPSPQQFYNALVRKGYETPEAEVPTMVDIHNFLNEACWGEVQKWEKKFHCDCKDLKLKKFQGRPQDLTPKARMYSWFGVEKPFDRHDWTIDRCGEDVRYVIDYYSAPDEEPGVPAFNCDVRPALDSPSAVFDRARMGAQRIWERVFGPSEAAHEAA
ncbi:cytochrome c/c1 heme-lyase [Fimicolochytrium jonesii]|uniref:cytochrome c/c1 heme-lyase n=1 Tax=Fimicolochytrium jonesii TaxID=1396493 RepID=UPI0022FF028C|nr:cytochrome c/c1 heme-lyase [Fimicolochytrium jonesii]KAI8825733.1 cytochrome c/c1 heme-lyase [Fimicolochytrium jonesii]